MTRLHSLWLGLAFARGCFAALHSHGHGFQPDEVLRVTRNKVNMACRYRDSVVVNGTSPGPEIRLKPEQTTWIRVYNDMDNENLTMHWHGLSQSVAPFSDGTPMVAQWPIPPHRFFDYELHPSADETGTYFYHSHVDFQTVSALGPLIVEDTSQPPYDYDEERTLLVSEYFNKSDSAIISGLEASPFVWSGEAMAVLLNGDSAPAQNPPAPSDAPLEGQCSPHMIRVEPNKTYRIRTIAGMALSAISYAIESHPNLTIIEADGRYTQPASTSHIELGSGQRYSYLLHTLTSAELSTLNKRNFWLQLSVRYRPTNYTSYACLSYDGLGCGTLPPQSPPASPPLIDLPTNDPTWLENTLTPLSPSLVSSFPTLSDVTHRINIHTEQVNISGSLVWHFNGRRLPLSTTRQVPYLVDIYNRGDAAVPMLTAAEAANDSYSDSFGAYAAKVGDVLEIVWSQRPNVPAGGFDVHPLHAHGGHFYDLGSGNGTYNPEENEKKFVVGGYTPMVRDTTFLYKWTEGKGLDVQGDQGWRAWRIRVEDAGVWLLHCHTLQHMVMGMGTVWVMGDAQEVVADGLNVQGYLSFGGDAYGVDDGGEGPWVEHYFEGKDGR